MYKKIRLFSGILLFSIMIIHTPLVAGMNSEKSYINAEVCSVEEQILEKCERSSASLKTGNISNRVTKISFSENDINLIALITMAEAEGESEYGKRLVIDTILNRVDSAYFPDTVYGVIYQPGHFSSVWDGRADRCWVMDDISELVREELKNRTSNEVLYFTASGYGRYGTPMFQEGNHYFCSY